jgi:predicted nucleotidyltransferase
MQVEVEPLCADENHKKKRVGLTRAKADDLIKCLVERVLLVNKDPQYLYGVSRVVIFGSYLTDKEKLGDIDVAVSLGPKECDKGKHRAADHDQSRREGRGNIVERIYWPQEKVLRALRGRNYGFSFHEFSEYEAMAAEWNTTGREIYRSEQFSPPWWIR